RRKPGWAHPYYWAGFVLSGARGKVATAPVPAQTTQITASDAIPAPKGEVLWTYQTDGRIQDSPALDGQLVFFGSEDGAVYALNRVTGALTWRFAAASKIFGQPQIAAEHVFFAAENGTVYALDKKNGREIWEAKVSGQVHASVAVNGGEVFVP